MVKIKQPFWQLKVPKSESETTLSMIIDSGSTEHIVNRLDCFATLRDLECPKYITCANKSRNANLIICQSGDIISYNDETNSYGCLQNVLYAPDLSENLFSLQKQVADGLCAIFGLCA